MRTSISKLAVAICSFVAFVAFMNFYIASNLGQPYLDTFSHRMHLNYTRDKIRFQTILRVKMKR